MRLSERNYYSAGANREYMSASQFKDFQRCEAMALAKVRGRYRQEATESMLIGSYVDAIFSGTLDAFKRAHPEIFTQKGALKAGFAHADEIVQRITKQRAMMARLSGEHQRVFTGEIAGVPFKAKLDSYVSGKCICDLKVMRDFRDKEVDGGFAPWWMAWRYDIQGAIYQEIVRQETGKRLPFILAAATKEDEPDLQLIQIDQDVLDAALKQVQNAAPRYEAIKAGIIKPERCETCEYCRRTKRVRLELSSEVF